jgi:hypothetical protein
LNESSHQWIDNSHRRERWMGAQWPLLAFTGVDGVPEAHVPSEATRVLRGDKDGPDGPGTVIGQGHARARSLRLESDQPTSLHRFTADSAQKRINDLDHFCCGAALLPNFVRA